MRCTNGREVSGFCDSHQECQFLGPQFRCQRNPSARVISGKQGGCCDNRIQGTGHYGGSSTGGGVADSYTGRSGPYVGPARGTKRVSKSRDGYTR